MRTYPKQQVRRINGSWFHTLIWLLLCMSSCTESGHGYSSIPAPASQPDSATLEARIQNPPTSTEQISQYIRRMFQDRDGNIWFGTTSDGVARYDGRALTYFTTADGLAGNWVSAMAQDARGDIWFATGGGVSRFDEETFTRYTTKDGLASDQVWCLLLDRSGGLWFGTEEGVSRFDPSAKTFTSFPIPAADLSKFPYYKYPKQINAIIQDKAGHIWFASNGGGVYRYDGKSLTNVSTNEGLCDDFVQTILQDNTGDLWFGTRHGGACSYDGRTFTSFGRDQLKGDDVSMVYQDSNGTIWIGVTRVGLCSHINGAFTCYSEKEGEGIRVIFCALEDASGQLWFGTGAGVYRLEAGAFVNWSRADALGSEAH